MVCEMPGTGRAAVAECLSQMQSVLPLYLPLYSPGVCVYGESRMRQTQRCYLASWVLSLLYLT